MAKKFFCLLFLLLPLTVFAETQISEKISTGLELFFEKTLNEDYDSAYKMLTDDFAKSTSLEDFKLILTETKLTAFTEKTWTSFKEDMMGALATIQGDFTTPNGEVHHMTFEIFVDAHEIKIRNISENISMKDLKKRFPPAQQVRPQVEQDLHAITDFLRQKNSKGLYEFLAANPQSKVTKIDIRKILSVLKKSKLTVEVPENAVVSMRKTPLLTKEGTMRMTGAYTNATAKIRFVLDYQYQWQWKLESFRFDVAPKVQTSI